jgi:hypothetical protein
MTYEKWIYMPAAQRSTVTSHFNDNPEPGYFRAIKTAELVSPDF